MSKKNSTHYLTVVNNQFYFTIYLNFLSTYAIILVNIFCRGLIESQIDTNTLAKLYNIHVYFSLLFKDSYDIFSQNSF